jgi:hypothetical protein
MIRVTVDLVPFGVESESRKIGELILANVSMKDNNTADYIYAFVSDKSDMQSGSVTSFDRSRGIWELIYECLSNSNTYIDEQDLDLLIRRMS